MLRLYRLCNYLQTRDVRDRAATIRERISQRNREIPKTCKHAPATAYFNAYLTGVKITVLWSEVGLMPLLITVPSSPKLARILKKRADQGVGRGPGGPYRPARARFSSPQIVPSGPDSSRNNR